MEKTWRKEFSIPFTHKDAQALNDLFDILEGIYGEEAQSHIQRYVKLWPKYYRLRKTGVDVRFSPHRLGRRPLLIIEGKGNYARL